MARAERRRGADAERAVVAWLREVGWPDTRRYLAGDGRQPGDIDWHPLVCLEVKDRDGSRWPSWCRQAVAECRPGMVPAVVRRTRGVPRVSSWEVRVQWRGWFDVLGCRHLPPDRGSIVAVFCRDGECAELCPGHDWLVMTMDDLANAVAAVDTRDDQGQGS